MNEERLLDVIRAPVVSEKAVDLSQTGQCFVFKVAKDSTKEEVKAAVEKLFNVEVTDVNTIVVKGKAKNFRGRKGRRSSWKKAYVRLQEGQSIDLGDTQAG